MSARYLLIAAAILTAAPATGQPAAPPQRQAPAAGTQPIPRATFIQNMNGDFGRMDADRDGKATRAEIEAFQRANALRGIIARNRAIFGELDKDRSGQLSAQEFAAFHAQPPPQNPAPMLQQFDSDRDGAITVVEFRAGTLANFDRLDTDKDGVVTAAEMKAGGIIKK